MLVSYSFLHQSILDIFETLDYFFLVFNYIIQPLDAVVRDVEFAFELFRKLSINGGVQS